MSRKVHLFVLALAAVALAAPIAQAGTGPNAQPKIDPLAVSYLRGQGLTPSQVKDWTVGACSYREKPASCFTEFGGIDLTTVRPADPLAASYLRGMGLSPDEVEAWTVGACSHESRPAVCYSALEKTPAPVQVVESGGFDWADAGIGAGATLGIVLLFSGLGAAFVISRQNRRQQAPSM